MTGELVFRNFGRMLARRHNGKVLHASYTANGVRPQHETLLERAKAVIVITADAGRNKYQAAFAKHISMLCRLSEDPEGRSLEKPCVVTAVSSPFDFATDKSIQSYICTYDFTDAALRTLVKVLCEDQKQVSAVFEAQQPVRTPNQARQQWLVENYRDDRDRIALDHLLLVAQTSSNTSAALLKSATAETFLLQSDLVEEAHFVVRNSSTKELIGFCATYYQRSDNTGFIGVIVVNPNRQFQSVGHSLHDRAIKALLLKDQYIQIKLGTRFPNAFPGVPLTDAAEYRKLAQWFSKLGWRFTSVKRLFRMAIFDLPQWEAPDGLGQSLAVPNIKYDLVHGEEYTDSVMQHVCPNSSSDVQAMYRIALGNKDGCAIIRGKRITDGNIVASVLLYRSQSKLARFVPRVQQQAVLAGGIGSAVMCADLQNKASLLQGLILLGVRQLKKQGIKALVLDCVSESKSEAEIELTLIGG